MKGIILYKSKHGSTKQYADWLSEETGFSKLDLNKDGKPDLREYEIVIIGSWILAGRIVAHGWIKKNWSYLKDKEVLIFSVGADEPTEKLRKEYMGSSLQDEINNKVSFYALRGRFRKEDQNFMLRGMLKFASKFEKEGDLSNNMLVGIDEVKKENLEEMLQHISSISK